MKGKKETKSKCSKQKSYKHGIINPTILIITLNVNHLNIPIQKHSLSEKIKIKTQICVVYKRPTVNIDMLKIEKEIEIISCILL